MSLKMSLPTCQQLQDTFQLIVLVMHSFGCSYLSKNKWLFLKFTNSWNSSVGQCLWPLTTRSEVQVFLLLIFFTYKKKIEVVLVVSHKFEFLSLIDLEALNQFTIEVVVVANLHEGIHQLSFLQNIWLKQNLPAYPKFVSQYLTILALLLWNMSCYSIIATSFLQNLEKKPETLNLVPHW